MNVRAVTLPAPYASLVAVGAKTIIDQARPTDYRGKLIVHQGTTWAEKDAKWVGPYLLGRWTDDLRHAEPCDCDEDNEGAGLRCLANSEWDHALFRDGGAHAPQFVARVPLGAVVATAVLDDVVPIGLPGRTPDPDQFTRVEWDGADLLLRHRYVDALDFGITTDNYSDQLPFGIFSPGRYAYLLSDVKPVEERCPRCGAERWRRERERTLGDDDCATCHGFGWCAPVQMRGHSGLWTPTWEAA